MLHGTKTTFVLDQKNDCHHITNIKKKTVNPFSYFGESLRFSLFSFIKTYFDITFWVGCWKWKPIVFYSTSSGSNLRSFHKKLQCHSLELQTVFSPAIVTINLWLSSTPCFVFCPQLRLINRHYRGSHCHAFFSSVSQQSRICSLSVNRQAASNLDTLLIFLAA